MNDDRLWTTVCVKCRHVCYDHKRVLRGTTEAAACSLCTCERYVGATREQELIREYVLMREAEMCGSQHAHDHLSANLNRTLGVVAAPVEDAK